jgi:hypothetical protein
MASSKNTRSDADQKITALEASAVEVAARIETLKREAITSDAAAGNLANAERRAACIDLELKELRVARDNAPGVDVLPALFVLDETVLFYRDAVIKDMLNAVDPFDYPQHLSLPLVAHCGAFMACNIIRDWISTVPEANMGTIRRILNYYHRALCGAINLHSDSPCEDESEGAAEIPAAISQL